MTRKIINIIVFAVAIVASVLSIVYAAMYDSDKEKVKQYNAVSVLQDKDQALLNDLSTAKPDNLTQFVDKHTAPLVEFDKNMSAEKQSKDAFFQYLSTLKSVTSENFEAFKADYPNGVDALLEVFDTNGTCKKDFAQVKTYEDFKKHCDVLKEKYDGVRQNYLVKENIRTAQAMLLDSVKGISKINNDSLRTAALTGYQNDVSNFQTLTGILNPTIVLTYIMILIPLLLLVFFALRGLILSFKTSYKTLLVILGGIVVFGVFVLIGSPELSPAFEKIELTPIEAKFIDASVYFVYTLLGVTILSMIVLPFIKIKKA